MGALASGLSNAVSVCTGPRGEPCLLETKGKEAPLTPKGPQAEGTLGIAGSAPKEAKAPEPKKTTTEVYKVAQEAVDAVESAPGFSKAEAWAKCEDAWQEVSAKGEMDEPPPVKAPAAAQAPAKAPEKAPVADAKPAAPKLAEPKQPALAAAPVTAPVKAPEAAPEPVKAPVAAAAPTKAPEAAPADAKAPAKAPEEKPVAAAVPAKAPPAAPTPEKKKEGSATTSPAQEARFWQVVGGEESGGILSRIGEDLKSPASKEGRLAFGAKVKEIKVRGERLNFKKVAGEGPEVGWVSLKFKGKDLLQLVPE